MSDRRLLRRLYDSNQFLQWQRVLTNWAVILQFRLYTIVMQCGGGNWIAVTLSTNLYSIIAFSILI